jgi:hypothetical protein
MMTNVLPELARANVGWLRQTLEQRGNGLSREEGAAFAVACDHVAGLFRALKDAVWQNLRTGVESRALLAQVTNVIRLAEEALGQFSAIRQKAAGANGGTPGLPSLEPATALVEQVRADLMAILARVDVNPSPPDLERLASLAGGPFVRLEDVSIGRGSAGA